MTIDQSDVLKMVTKEPSKAIAREIVKEGVAGPDTMVAEAVVVPVQAPPERADPALTEAPS
ncbi:hypothetical protein EBZ37_11620, partial [bacterium]|nr:hypothetical protein [bacterium]